MLSSWRKQGIPQLSTQPKDTGRKQGEQGNGAASCMRDESKGSLWNFRKRNVVLFSALQGSLPLVLATGDIKCAFYWKSLGSANCNNKAAHGFVFAKGKGLILLMLCHRHFLIREMGPWRGFKRIEWLWRRGLQPVLRALSLLPPVPSVQAHSKSDWAAETPLYSFSWATAAALVQSILPSSNLYCTTLQLRGIKSCTAPSTTQNIQKPMRT